MIDKLEKKCMGCGACKNICPKDAIRMTYEKSLFYEPSVDYDLCIKCGKCTSICPAVSFLSKNNNNPTAFAIASNDEERLKSSSGAFFPILAKHILNQNGFVCGAAWTEDWNVQHIIVSNSKDVDKLRLSKYIQSNTGNCFREIKNKLLNNELVLFSGTPCQNAGLKNYLGKEYDNLITMDLLCHGSPSPKIWEEYLRTNFNIENIKEIRFRTKDNGWVSSYKCPFDEKYSYIDDGQKKPIGLYYVSFLRHIISTDACIDCKYKGLPRVADFTCGDFWAYKKYNENLNDNKGLSVVLINNRKAESIFENIKNQFIVCEQIDMTDKWEDIEISNKSRFRNERYMFYKNFDKFSLNKSLELASRTHFDIGLVSFFNGMNYGSSLVAFATNKILENLGYSVLMINKPYNAIYPYDETNKSYEFAKTHFYLSNFYERNESCDYINNLVDTFIVGSDTQWWWNDVSSIKYHPWLDFVQADKRKISLSTSFANDFTDIPKEEIPIIKKLYERFDSLSVREKSGVTILSEVFGIEKSVALIDPTLVLDTNYYDEIIEESELQVKNYVFAYILDLTEDKENALIDFSKKINKPLRVVPRQYHKGSMKIVTDNNCSIPDFLYLIKNADLVITDSFHGACFSVIFEKNFATMINNKRGNTKFEIFKQMGLSKCLLDSPEELKRYNFDEHVDFSDARIFIEKERCKFYDYLKNHYTLNKGIYMINFTVGPVQMDNETLSIGKEQIPYFRTAEFSQIMKENESLLCEYFYAPEKSRAIFLTASGTGSMEAGIMNFFTSKDKVLVVNGGSFGERFIQLCEIHEIPFTEIKLDFGTPLTKKILDFYDSQGYTGVVLQLCETSSGVLYDMELVGEFCHNNNCFLFVDAISGFLADEVSMKKCHINAVITGSQKALALPPSMSFTILDEEAQKRCYANKAKSMYFDYADYLKNGKRGQTPFTPAVGTLLQLHEKLLRIKKMGGIVLNNLARERAMYFRNGIKHLPLKMFVPSKYASNCVTALSPTNSSVNAHKIFEIIKDEYDMWICPNGGTMAEKVFRVGHIGSISKEEIDKLIKVFENLVERNLL